MALFGRRKSTTAAPVDERVLVSDQDVRTLQLAMADMAAVGSDSAMRAAMHRFSRAGGALSMEEIIRRGLPATNLSRPWLWLGETLALARDSGQTDLVVQTCAFFNLWVSTIEPKVGLADEMDMNLSKSSPAARAKIWSESVLTLSALPGNAVAVDHATGQLRVGDILSHVAFLCSSVESLMTAEAQEIVRRQR